MKKLGKIIKSKAVSLETMAKINRTLIFPIIMYGYPSWTAKKADGKKNWFICNMMLENSSTNILDCQTHEQVDPKAN